MTPLRSFLCVAFGCAVLSVGLAAAAEPASADLDVRQVTPEDAVVALRAVAGARNVAVVDEDTVRVSGTPEELAVASVVVELLELPTDTAEQVTARVLADDSHVARVVLRHASTSDVVLALRAKIGISRFAVNAPTATILVRDTQEQVRAALDLIAAMEREGS